MNARCVRRKRLLAQRGRARLMQVMHQRHSKRVERLLPRAKQSPGVSFRFSRPPRSAIVRRRRSSGEARHVRARPRIFRRPDAERARGAFPPESRSAGRRGARRAPRRLRPDRAARFVPRRLHERLRARRLPAANAGRSLAPLLARRRSGVPRPVRPRRDRGRLSPSPSASSRPLRSRALVGAFDRDRRGVVRRDRRRAGSLGLPRRDRRRGRVRPRPDTLPALAALAAGDAGARGLVARAERGRCGRGRA